MAADGGVDRKRRAIFLYLMLAVTASMLKSVLFFALTQLRGARAPASVLMSGSRRLAPLSDLVSPFGCPLEHFSFSFIGFGFLSSLIENFMRDRTTPFSRSRQSKYRSKRSFEVYTVED